MRWEHLEENKETYFSHFKFASVVGVSLIFRGTIFILHALLPVKDMPKRWNVENTLNKLYEWNNYTIRRRKRQ